MGGYLQRMPKGSLRDACSPARLTQLAGRPSYERGERYAAEHRVTLLTVDDDAAVATVAGNDMYRVWEGDDTGAWEEAQRGGCSRELWRRLARMRAADRPEDAVGVYRALLDRTIELKSDSAYEEAIELLAELHLLLAPAGHEEAHTELVGEIRGTHRRKRNLIRMLDAQEWPMSCR